MRPSILAIGLFASACGGPSGPLPFTVTLLEFLGGNGVEGAEVRLDDQVATTDDLGQAVFQVMPQTAMVIETSHEGYRDAVMYDYQGSAAGEGEYLVPSDDTITLLSERMNVEVDPTKALVAVTVQAYDPDVEGDEIEPIDGVMVELDAAYEVALVLDSGSVTGLKRGQTTLLGSGSTVAFVNVDPGTITAELTLPEGVTCGFTQDTVVAAAGSYVVANDICAR